MRQKHRILSLATAAVILVFGLAAGLPAGATDKGTVVDRATFDAGVPSGWTGFSDFNGCEFTRSADGDKQYQRIPSGDNDTCANHTPGAPGPGDVSISNSFSANPDEVYKGYAKGWIENPVDSVAQVKILFWKNTSSGREFIGECFGKTSSTSSTVFNTCCHRAGPNPPEITAANGCKAPSGTDEVVISYRIHAQDAGASGRAVLDRITFGRCNEGNDCSNVTSP